MNKPSQEKILSTVVIAIIAICQALNAEETAKSIEVLVTATREKNIFDTPYSVSVVDRNYLVENQIRTTPEVLQEVTGPMVQKTSFGHGSPYIRGLTGFRNLFLIDGIRLNNSCFREGPNQYWNTIDNLLIERMEILKGSSSVLYGSDALGGTVAVFTPEPDMTKERYSASKVFSRYSYAENSVVTRVEQEGKLERLGFILGGTSKKFGDIIAGKDTGRLPNTGYEEWDADFKAIYQINEKDKLIFAYQKTVQDDVPRTHRTIYSKSYEGTKIGTDLRADYDQNRELSYIQYHWDESPNFYRAGTISLSWHKQAETFERLTSDEKNEIRKFTVNTLGFTSRIITPVRTGTLTYGLEYYSDFVDSSGKDISRTGSITQYARGEVPDDSTYSMLGLYLQKEFTPFSLFELNMGARYSLVRLKAEQVDPNPASPTPGLEPFSKSYDAVVGSIRGVYHITDYLNAVAGISQGFRAPGFDDTAAIRLVMSGQTDYPSPELRPEKSLTYEAGIKTCSEKIQGSFFYYYTEIDDLIRRVSAPQFGPEATTKENFGNASIQGIEIESSYKINHEWSVAGILNWVIDSEGDALVDPVTGTPSTSISGVKRSVPLDKIQPPTGILKLRWTHPSKKCWVEAVTTAVGEKKYKDYSPSDKTDTQRIPPGGSPGYVIVSLRSGIRLSQSASLNLAVNNLTDKDYRVFGSGQNEPGINPVVSLEVNF